VLVLLGVVGVGAATIRTHAAGGGSDGPPPANQALLNRSLTPPPDAAPPAAKHPGLRPCTALARSGMDGRGVFRPDQLGISVSIPNSQAHVTTMWEDVQNGMHVTLLAGVDASDPSQGVIIVSAGNDCTGQRSSVQ